MRIDSLHQELKALARTGDPDVFVHLIEQFEAALDARAGHILDELHDRLSQAGDVDSVNAFDACMDLLCAEGSDRLSESLDAVLPQTPVWRCFVLSLALVQPLGARVVRWPQPQPIEARVAAHLGLSQSDVVLDPYVLAPRAAFDFTPLEAHQHCQLAKSRASGVRLSVLDELRRNDWPEGSAVTGRELVEALGVLCVRADDETASEMLAALQGLAAAGPLFEMEPGEQEGKSAPPQEACGRVPAPVKVQVQLLDAAAPWTAFTQFLHDVQVKRLAASLPRLCRQARLPLASVQVVCVTPRNRADSVRVSLLDGTGGLLGGLDERDMHAPELYGWKVGRWCEEQGLKTPLFLDEPIPDVCGQTQQLFWVPNLGWSALSTADRHSSRGAS